MKAWWETFFDRDIAQALLSRPRPGEIDFLKRELELRPGGLVFDQCCGWGRLSKPLSELGYQVVGVDGAPEMVKLGRERAPGVDFHLADAADFVPNVACGAGMNLYSSFDCAVEDHQNLKLLQRLSESLTKNARVVLDTINPGRVLSSFQPVMTTSYEDGTTLSRRSTLDWTRGLLEQEWTLQKPTGAAQHKTGHTKLYLPHTLAAMLAQVGLEPLRLYGDFQARPFETTSERLIWIAQKR